MTSFKEVKIQKQEDTMLNRKGFTIIELLVVVMIIGILAFALYSLLFSRESTAKIMAAEKQVFDIYGVAQEWKVRTGRLDYTGISMNALASAVPGFNANLQNPWGGTYAVAPANNNADVAITVNSVGANDAAGLVARFTSKGYTATNNNNNVTVTLP